MGNVKVEAKHYEQAIEELKSCQAHENVAFVVMNVTHRARELAHAEQEKQE